MTGTQVINLDFKPKSPIEAAIEIYGEFSASKSRMEAEAPDLLYNILADALRKIADQFTTETYEFIRAIDKFVEQSITCITEPLKYILNEYIPCRDASTSHQLNMSTLFCAYYALSLVYKKQKDVDGLKMLLDADNDLNKGSKYDVFSDFPLYYEVLARCYKHQNHLHIALDYDQHALDLLAQHGIVNCAVGASFASTTSMILSQRQHIDAETVKRAREYIENAIDYNSAYPKYYFLKAKLLYYSTRQADIHNTHFQKICSEALYLLEKKALRLLLDPTIGSSDYRTYEEDTYHKLQLIIRQARDKKDRDNDDEDPAHLKERILMSAHYKKCLPPMPELDADQPYFYICYAAQDFKSVYCDIAELLNRRIPFKYNNNPTIKNNWNAQMKADIESELCLGVVFYISRNTLTSKPLCHNIRKVCQELQKNYFAVNLEGKTKPSHILIDTIYEVYSNGKRNLLDGSHLRSFLMAFPDNEPWTAKDKHYGEDNTRHFNDYLQRLRSIFNMEI